MPRTVNPVEKNKPDFSLPKSVRIRRNKDLELLFGTGRRFFSHPIVCMVVFRPAVPGEPRLQVLFMAPKRRYRKAVSRNAAKRRLREVFRRSAPEILPQIPDNLTMLISLSPAGEKIPAFHETFSAFSRLLKRMVFPYLVSVSSAANDKE